MFIWYESIQAYVEGWTNNIHAKYIFSHFNQPDNVVRQDKATCVDNAVQTLLKAANQGVNPRFVSQKPHEFFHKPLQDASGRVSSRFVYCPLFVVVTSDRGHHWRQWAVTWLEAACAHRPCPVLATHYSCYADNDRRLQYCYHFNLLFHRDWRSWRSVWSKSYCLYKT